MMSARQQLNELVGVDLASKWIGMIQEQNRLDELHSEYNRARTRFYKYPTEENERIMDDLYIRLYREDNERVSVVG